jgi:hypothetical protein
MARNDSSRTYPDDWDDFEFNGVNFADESIIGVKDDAKRQLIEAGLDEEQAEHNAQFLASGLSTFAHRAGMTSGELYRALGLKIVADEITGGAKMYAQPAYHGGPIRDITEFSTDFIGTGEGGQAYGWGLYCAESRETGEEYRKKIGLRPALQAGRLKTDGTANRANAAARYINGGWGDKDVKKILSHFEPSLDEAALDEAVADGRRFLEELRRKHGQLYRLDIPEDDVLLDWDKPLSEQPEHVKAIIESLTTPEMTRYMNELKYELKILRLSGNGAEMPATGEIFYNALSAALGSEQAASLALDGAGIPGHRYLDRLSRDRGEGTHNYVIYDGRNMKVRETYYQTAHSGTLSGGDLGERTMQAISSANTSLNQVPASFKAVNWRPGTTNTDIGGGRYDAGTEYLALKGVTNLVFDPFNRDEKFNRKVFGELKKGTDTATVSNVLNVIAEPEIRQEVIRQAAKAIKPDGTEYFQIYEGDGLGNGQQTTKGWQNNARTSSYVADVEKYFSDVTRKGNVITAKSPKPGNTPALWMMDALGKSVEYYQKRRETSTEAQPRGAIDFTDPNGVTITLTPSADATTTIHEMGHLFRWLLERQAAAFPGDKQLQADWNAVRDFGDHEKFADAAIEYAMTGNAPSPSLRSAFDMFRQCLVRFYEAIRGNTGVKLDEEIKGVFDRILKSDAMKAARTITPDSLAPSEKSAFFQSGREPPPENDMTHTNQDHKQTKEKGSGFMDFRYLFSEDAVIKPKVRKTAELFASHLGEVTKDAGSWASFLDCASRMYKYSFVDQTLIHAQRPGAVACAAMDLWNERIGRWVKRGSKGIALIDASNPQNPSLKYVFDINDTVQSRSKAEPPYIWRMEREHIPHVRKTLANAFGFDDPDMKTQITGIVKRLAVASSGRNEQDEKFKNFVASSAVYCIMARRGLKMDAKEAFPGISGFDTDEKVLELGLATVELSEQILRNVERVVRGYDRWIQQRNERREDNGRIGVRAGRGLPDTRADAGRQTGQTAGQVRPDEAQAPEGQRQFPVQPAHDTRAVV